MGVPPPRLSPARTHLGVTPCPVGSCLSTTQLDCEGLSYRRGVEVTIPAPLRGPHRVGRRNTAAVSRARRSHSRLTPAPRPPVLTSRCRRWRLGAPPPPSLCRTQGCPSQLARLPKCDDQREERGEVAEPHGSYRCRLDVIRGEARWGPAQLDRYPEHASRVTPPPRRNGHGRRR